MWCCPGLPDHPGHELAKKQMKKFGGIMFVQFKGGEAAAGRLSEAISVFTLAESLGGIESLMNYPSEMTHASVKGAELAVPVNLIRLSCGIEDVGGSHRGPRARLQLHPVTAAPRGDPRPDGTARGRCSQHYRSQQSGSQHGRRPQGGNG